MTIQTHTVQPTTLGLKHKGDYPGYETTIVLKSDLGDDGVVALQEKIANITKEFGGSVVLNEDWGRRKLAYPVRKESRAHYTYVVYTAKPGVVHEIERNLRIHEHVLRFLTVNLEKEFDGELFKKQRADVHAAAKRREEEMERRREERAAERRAMQDDGGYDDER